MDDTTLSLLKAREDHARQLIRTANAEADARMVRLGRALATLEESVLADGFDNFVDPREWQTDEYGMQLAGSGWTSVGADRSDREHGDNHPYYRTEQDLATIRAQARYLTTGNELGVHILETLTDYVVGDGYKFRFKLRNEREDASFLPVAKTCQRLVDRFIEDNNWQGDADRELFTRLRRDGEAFPILFQDGPRCVLRMGEPEQCVEPAGYRDIEDRYAIGRPGDWKWGVHTAADDVEQVYGYYFQWSESTADFSYLPRSMVEHVKVNVDRKVKRGMSDFYPVIPRLHRLAKLLRNTEEGATIQAAIAYIVEAAEGVNRTAAESADLRQSDYAAPIRAGRSTRTQNVRNISAGTVLTTPHGQEYKPGPMGAQHSPNLMLVLQASMRFVGNRWNMPEYLVSGDASNANYASTMVAESPWVKSCKAKQAQMKTAYGAIMWRVVEAGIKSGAFEAFGFWKMDDDACRKIRDLVILDIEAPQLEVRDRKAETDRNAVLNQRGILSKQTWTGKEGEDWDTEQDNLQEEGPAMAIDPLTGLPMPMQPGASIPGQPGQLPPVAGQLPPGQQAGQQQPPRPDAIREAAALLWGGYPEGE